MGRTLGDELREEYEERAGIPNPPVIPKPVFPTYVGRYSRYSTFEGVLLLLVGLLAGLLAGMHIR